MIELCKQKIEEVYQQNLELAKEELTFQDTIPNPQDVHNLASEWTTDDFARMVHSFLDQKWARRDELINKNFFD